MTEHHGKGLKPFVLKYMALFMGICYLTNPLHEQIRTVFHQISHIVESPGTILSHPSDLTNHKHSIHQDHEHHHVATDQVQHHEHKFLDLMQSLFGASDGEHPENDTLLPPIKWDKHISSQDFILPQPIVLSTTSRDYGAIEKNVRKGYLALLYEPPQAFPTSI